PISSFLATPLPLSLLSCSSFPPLLPHPPHAHTSSIPLLILPPPYPPSSRPLGLLAHSSRTCPPSPPPPSSPPPSPPVKNTSIHILAPNGEVVKKVTPPHSVDALLSAPVDCLLLRSDERVSLDDVQQERVLAEMKVPLFIP